MVVIDASVYVSLVNADERNHDQSLAWFSQALMESEPVVAPAILLPEVAAALCRGTGDTRVVRTVIEQLQASTRIELAAVSLDMAERAARIAGQHRIRGCDAIYVALAEQLDCELVTLDRQQRERGSAVVSTREP